MNTEVLKIQIPEAKYREYLRELLGCMEIPTSHIERVLWETVLNYKPKTIVELGVAGSYEIMWHNDPWRVVDKSDNGAYTSRIFALACRELHKQGIESHLFAFDIRPESELRVKEMFSRLGLSKYVTLTLGIDDLEAVKNWNKKIQLLFVDSSHTYEQTIGELREWGKFLQAEGILVMHDIEDQGVKKARQQYFRKHPFEPLWRVPAWAGAWRKKGTILEKLWRKKRGARALFRAKIRHTKKTLNLKLFSKKKRNLRFFILWNRLFSVRKLLGSKGGEKMSKHQINKKKSQERTEKMILNIDSEFIS